MDVRKSIKVEPVVKDAIKHVQQQIGFKTESEAIHYLCMVHTWALAKMPAGIYREAQQIAREVKNQVDIAAAIHRARGVAENEAKRETYLSEYEDIMNRYEGAADKHARDVELAKLMTKLERTFDIPMVGREWIERFQKEHPDVWELYRKVSLSRE